jgi:hypothetical protein
MYCDSNLKSSSSLKFDNPNMQQIKRSRCGDFYSREILKKYCYINIKVKCFFSLSCNLQIEKDKLESIWIQLYESGLLIF